MACTTQCAVDYHLSRFWFEPLNNLIEQNRDMFRHVERCPYVSLARRMAKRWAAHCVHPDTDPGHIRVPPARLVPAVLLPRDALASRCGYLPLPRYVLPQGPQEPTVVFRRRAMLQAFAFVCNTGFVRIGRMDNALSVHEATCRHCCQKNHSFDGFAFTEPKAVSAI